jgi:hypothetical protein
MAIYDWDTLWDRIVSTETSQDNAPYYASHINGPHQQQPEAYKIMPLCEMFDISEVYVEIRRRFLCPYLVLLHTQNLKEKNN